MDEARRILAELSQIVVRYGHDERANLVRHLIDQEAEEGFWLALAGREFWGGSGAVWEIEPFHLSDPQMETSAEDYRRFQVLMVELVDLLDAKGLSGLAARTGDLFRRKLEAEQ